MMSIPRQKDIDALFQRCKKSAAITRDRDAEKKEHKRRRVCSYLGACEKRPGRILSLGPPPQDRCKLLAMPQSGSGSESWSGSELGSSREDDQGFAEMLCHPFAQTKTAAFAACSWVPLWWKRLHDEPSPIAHPFVFIRDAHPGIASFLKDSWSQEYRGMVFEGSSIPVCGVYDLTTMTESMAIERAAPGARALRRHALTVVFICGDGEYLIDPVNFVPPKWRFLELSLSEESKVVNAFLKRWSVAGLVRVLAHVRNEQERQMTVSPSSQSMTPASTQTDTLFQVVLRNYRLSPSEIVSCHQPDISFLEDIEKICSVAPRREEQNPHDWV